MQNHETPPSPPSDRRRLALPFLVLVGLVLLLALLFFFVIRSLALPLVLGAVVAMMLHPLQEGLTRRLGGAAWAAALILTVVFVVTILAPLLTAVYMAQGELQTLLAEAEPDTGKGGLLPVDSPRVRTGLAWVSEQTGIAETRMREWVRLGAADLQQALYLRSLELLGNLPGIVLGLFVFLLTLFFLLKDGPELVQRWEALTPLEDRHERLIHREFIRVCRGVLWSALTVCTIQGVLFGAGLFVIDRFTETGLRPWIFALALLTMVSSTIPFLGAAAVWATTSAFLFANGNYPAAIALAIYGGAVISQVDAFIYMYVLKGTARMHPLLVFVSVLGGIQLLGILGLIVGPATAAVLFALLRVLKKDNAHPPQEETAERSPAETEMIAT